MPTKIVDLSARSEVIRGEPMEVHFWQCTPGEFRSYLGRPRDFLRKLGIVLPHECRIETTIENHDWLADEAPDFEGEHDTMVCNVGTGAAGHPVYRVRSYARDKGDCGRFTKALLHSAERQHAKERDGSDNGKKRKGHKPGKKAHKATA